MQAEEFTNHVVQMFQVTMETYDDALDEMFMMNLKHAREKADIANDSGESMNGCVYRSSHGVEPIMCGAVGLPRHVSNGVIHTPEFLLYKD